MLSTSLWGGMLLPLGDKPSCIADRLVNSLIGKNNPLTHKVMLFLYLNLFLGSIWVVRPVWGASACTASALRVKVTDSNSLSVKLNISIFTTKVCFLTLMTGDYLGGEAYWAGGVHLYTPLPFRPGRGGFGDLFRTHFFLNAGNLCNLNYGEIQKAAMVLFFSVFTYICCYNWNHPLGEGPRAHLSKLAECIRWSYGAGIVLRLGNIARLELNYCIPMGVQSGDR